MHSAPAPRGAYVRFTPARPVTLGRSAGYTTLPAVQYVEGRVTRETADSLWLVVARARGPRGEAFSIPLGATAVIATDDHAAVAFGQVPDVAGTSGRAVAIGVGAVFVVAVVIPALVLWLVLGNADT